MMNVFSRFAPLVTIAFLGLLASLWGSAQPVQAQAGPPASPIASPSPFPKFVWGNISASGRNRGIPAQLVVEALHPRLVSGGFPLVAEAGGVRVGQLHVAAKYNKEFRAAGRDSRRRIVTQSWDYSTGEDTRRWELHGELTLTANPILPDGSYGPSWVGKGVAVDAWRPYDQSTSISRSYSCTSFFGTAEQVTVWEDEEAAHVSVWEEVLNEAATELIANLLGWHQTEVARQRQPPSPSLGLRSASFGSAVARQATIVPPAELADLTIGDVVRLHGAMSVWQATIVGFTREGYWLLQYLGPPLSPTLERIERSQ